jgi:hypothetical protein
MKPRGLVLVPVAFILVASTAVLSNDIPEVLKQMGLVGRWSTDCSADASPRSNVSYEIGPDGRVTVDNGLNVVVLTATSINAEGDLILQTTPSRGEEVKVLLLRRSGDALRPVINRNQPNDYNIQDGKFAASLRETFLLRRCGN